MEDPDVDIGTVILEIESHYDPNIDFRACQAELDDIVQVLRPLVSRTQNDSERLLAIVHRLLGKGLLSYDGSYTSSGRLSDVLAHRMGNCLSLSLLLVAVGQRLGIPINIHMAPGHAYVCNGEAGLILETSTARFVTEGYFKGLWKQQRGSTWYFRRLTVREIIGVVLDNQATLLTKSRREAIACWELARTVSPNDPQLHVNLGLAYISASRYRDAASCLREACRLDSHSSVAWGAYGEALLLVGKPGEALKAIDASLAIDSNYAIAWRNRGRAWAKTGRRAEAVESFGNAVSIDPNDEESLYDRGYNLVLLGRYREAVEDFECFLRLNRSSPGAWLILGFTLNEMKEYEKAVDAFGEVLRIAPGNTDALLERARARKCCGMYSEAILDYSVAIERGAALAEALHGRGETRYRAGSYVDALKDLDRAVQLSPMDGNILSDRGHVLLKLGYPDRAVRDFTAAAHMGCQVSLQYVKIAKAAFRDGDLAGAVAWLSRAVAARHLCTPHQTNARRE